MGRSVSTHRHAVETVYLHLEVEEAHTYQEDWDDFITDLQDNVLKEKYPSLTDCDRWQDREDHVILENRQVEVSVSEYCGCVAICLAPLDPDNNFHVAIAERAAKGFTACLHKAFPSSALRSQGFMSNGGQVFTKVSA